MENSNDLQEQNLGENNENDINTSELVNYEDTVVSSLNNVIILYSIELFLIFAVIGCLIGKSMWDKVKL